MILTTFSLAVSYSQLVVSDSSIENPFNDWSDRHMIQGFAWRPGSVAFATLENSASYEVEVRVDPIQERPDPDAARVIQTPFIVPPSGSVTIESVLSELNVLDLEPGKYNLQFECFPSFVEFEGRVRLVFTKTKTPRFAILRADPQLTIDGELLLTAEPA